MTTVAVDTSVAVPLLVRGHPEHDSVLHWASNHGLVLAGHAALETYSVLTRLPDALRVDPVSAARAVDDGFGGSVHPRVPESIVRLLAASGITGGAVWDALVAIAADEAGLALASRDARAIPTYARIGVRVEIVP